MTERENVVSSWEDFPVHQPAWIRHIATCVDAEAALTPTPV